MPSRLRKNASGAGKNTPRAFPSELNRSENFYFTALPIYRGHVAPALPCFPAAPRGLPCLNDVANLYRSASRPFISRVENRRINFPESERPLEGRSPLPATVTIARRRVLEDPSCLSCIMDSHLSGRDATWNRENILEKNSCVPMDRYCFTRKQ